MKLKLTSVCAVVCMAALAACSKDATTPASPTSTASSTAASNPDGSTLKVTAPAPQSPADGARLENASTVVLTVTNSGAKFTDNIAIRYHFQVINAAGATVSENGSVPSGVGTTSWAVPVQLEGDQTYRWRARVEVTEGVGPWSNYVSFVAPQNDGYLRGSELYDPLINGKSVAGSLVGPMYFIPGVGLRFTSQLSYAAYILPQTLTEGEFSLLITGMDKNTDGGKTKLFAMGQGFDDIVTNDRRMTVEKRGDPAGVVAWRFITHDDQVDTEGADRQEVNFSADQNYFWQATWRGNVFRVIIREGGVDGRTIYDKGKPFKGAAYDPNPHVIYLGSPVGRSGADGASVDNVTYRQVWVSGRARPTFANK